MICLINKDQTRKYFEHFEQFNLALLKINFSQVVKQAQYLLYCVDQIWQMLIFFLHHIYTKQQYIFRLRCFGELNGTFESRINTKWMLLKSKRFENIN